MDGLIIRFPHGAGKMDGTFALLPIFEPFRAVVSPLYWVVNGVTYDGPAFADAVADDDDNDTFYRDRDGFLMAELGDIRLMRPGFLAWAAPYVGGDWDEILGVARPPASLDTGVLDRDRIDSEGEIYFSCVDAAFWSVFARDATLLDRLVERFPESYRVALQDIWW